MEEEEHCILTVDEDESTDREIMKEKKSKEREDTGKNNLFFTK